MKPIVFKILVCLLPFVIAGCGDRVTTESAPNTANAQPASTEAINARNQAIAAHKQLVRTR